MSRRRQHPDPQRRARIRHGVRHAARGRIRSGGSIATGILTIRRGGEILLLHMLGEFLCATGQPIQDPVPRTGTQGLPGGAEALRIRTHPETRTAPHGGIESLQRSGDPFAFRGQPLDVITRLRTIHALECHDVLPPDDR